MSFFSQLVPAFGRQPAAPREGASRDPGATVKPVYEIKETDEAYGLTVYLPGVAKDGLELTADDGVLTIVGRRAWKRPEAWTALYRESSDTAFELTLTHDNTIDLEKIQAELRDGVLRVALPKAEAIKPRKIAVA